MSTVESWASTFAVPSAAVRESHLRARVYVSSAARDLRQARAVVIEAVHRSGCEPVAMESYGADTRPPFERCLLDVGSSDVYVGIVAWRYGSCPPGERKSFTHLEYEEAVRLDKHILLFHLDENAAWPPSHVDQSRRNVNKLRSVQSRNHIVDHFSTLEQLSTGVRRALRRLYRETGASVPELLPYVVDRDAQKDSLAAAVSRGSLERSPSVVVVHGAADQAHHKFVEYMQEKLLPQNLGVGPVDIIPIALHSTVFDQPDVITHRIARECSLDPTADIDVLSRQLHDSDLITMLWFPVEVEVCRGRPQPRPIVQLVDYFARWPPYRPLRVLPIISAQYRKATGWSGRLPWGAGASPNRFGPAIEQAVAAAANGEIVVLPELTNVEQVEVEVWAYRAEVRRLLGDRDPMPAIRRIFQEHELSSKERGMPMDTLAEELTHLLRHLSPWQEAPT